MNETRGMRILLVEDEALIAMMAEDMIEGLGHIIVRTAATLDEALDAAQGTDFDIALLDVNLNGDSSMSVAALLKSAGRPTAFTTGYGATGIDGTHTDLPVLTKPYSIAELDATIELLAAQLDGTSSTTSTIDSNRG